MSLNGLQRFIWAAQGKKHSSARRLRKSNELKISKPGSYMRQADRGASYPALEITSN